MLTRQLINATLQRLAEAEIIPVQGQNFLAANSVENPVRQLDFDPEQAAIKPVFSADCSRVNEPETFTLLLVARADVGCNARSCETINRFDKGVIVTSRGSAIREHKQVIARDADALPYRFFSLQLLHDLRNAIDQDVLVVDRRKAFDARHDLQPVSVMLVFPNRGIWFLRKREEGMLHLRDEILECSIRHVADEQIAIARVSRAGGGHLDSWYQVPSAHIRGFRYQVKRFVLSGTARRFVVSGAEIRAFGYFKSWFQVRKFVVSGSERQKIICANRGLKSIFTSVTLLNTDSNLDNTKGFGNKEERGSDQVQFTRRF